MKPCTIALAVVLSSCFQPPRNANEQLPTVDGRMENGNSEASKTSPADADRKAVILAIEDEIYDEGCEGYGFDAAATHDEKSYELPVYFEPTVKKANESGLDEGSVIYRLLPIGEVEREYSVDLGVLATLYGHPEWNFPPTSPSQRAVFVDDNTLYQLKHDSVRATFTLDLSPSPQRVREAGARQRQRMGERYRAHKRDCSFGWR
jgi:hypothetical protein